MAKCVHGYESEFCGNIHGAWRHDGPTDGHDEPSDDYRFMMTGGIYPSEERAAMIESTVQEYTEEYVTDNSSSEAKKARAYFQRKLQDYGYAKHLAKAKEETLEDAGFYVCKNCSTMSLTNEYGLCRYCDELSDLRRSQAVTDGHKKEYLKARHSVTINRRIYWSMFGIWAALMTVFIVMGWGEVLASGGIVSTLAMILATPGYISDTNRYKKQAAKVLEEHPELQYLAARATSGSTGPR